MIRVYWLKVHPLVAHGTTNTHMELGPRVAAPGLRETRFTFERNWTTTKTKAPPLTSNKGGAEGFRDCGKGFYGFAVLRRARGTKPRRH